MTNLKARLDKLEREALGDELTLEDIVQDDGPMREGRMPPRLAKICKLILSAGSRPKDSAAGGKQ